VQKSKRAGSSRSFFEARAPTRTAKERRLYRIRYLVEVCFHELKRFRAIGTRYDKTKSSYMALLHVACICLWLA
jgi:transposase